MFYLNKNIIFAFFFRQSLLLYHFYLNFILFVHSDYVNFNCNQCSIFTEPCFQLWKRFEWSKSLLVRFLQSNKKLPLKQNLQLSSLGEFSPNPEYHLVKTWTVHFHHNRILAKKTAKVKINFVYLTCTIMLKKTLKADHEA